MNTPKRLATALILIPLNSTTASEGFRRIKSRNNSLLIASIYVV